MAKTLLALCMLAMVAAVAAADPAEGIWKSISDVKGEEGKVTAFWKVEIVDGTLQGRILHVPGDPDSKPYACKKKDFNGKPVVGTIWLYGLRSKAEGVWRDGKIVDVGNDKGDVYGCDVTMKEGGAVLNMKGYLNILGVKIGREQNWLKSNQEELETAQAATKAKLGN